jgi:hypothetical protein
MGHSCTVKPVCEHTFENCVLGSGPQTRSVYVYVVCKSVHGVSQSKNLLTDVGNIEQTPIYVSQTLARVCPAPLIIIYIGLKGTV